MEPRRAADGSFGSDRLDMLARVEMEERGLSLDRSMLSELLLAGHPDDDGCSDEGPGSPRLMGGSEYVRQYIYMTTCFLVALAGYTVQRLACKLGLPDDCLKEIDYLEFFSDVTSLGLCSLALGWLVGLSEPSRFRWLFSRRRWYAGAVFLGTPPVYSAISNISALKGDLAHTTAWSVSYIAITTLGLAVAGGAVAWHVRAAWRRAGTGAFAVYVLTRLVILSWFAGSAAILAASAHPPHIHLHHLYIGLALAAWADANAGFSAITLAIGSGIFVQGVGAYSFAPVFTKNDCFETPAAAEVQCKFWADSPFTLRVCGSGGAAAAHACDAGGGSSA